MSMAIRPETRDRVFKVADELLEQGIKPTQQNVRDKLGSGSLTTINKALGEWWVSLSERLQRMGQHPDIPQPVLTIACKTWDQALAYAEDRFRSREAELLNELDDLNAQQRTSSGVSLEAFEALQKQYQRALERNDELSTRAELYQQEKMSLEQAVIQATSDKEAMARTVKQQELLLERGSGVDETALFDSRLQQKLLEQEAHRLRDENLSLQGELSRLRDQLAESKKERMESEHQLQLELAREKLINEEKSRKLNEYKLANS